MLLDQTGSPFPVESNRQEPNHPRRLEGFLYLTATRDQRGKTILTRKAFRPPIHVSKPYQKGSALLVNMMSPTAGMLEGDRVLIDAELEEDAHLVLSNPTALRIHKMSLNEAQWDQEIRIAPGAFLESHPEWIIPQAKSRFRQTTRIHLSPGARLLFIEALASGRVAFGEQFEFDSIRSRLELRYEDKLAALEKWALRPSSKTISGWQSYLDTPFYISIYMCAPELESDDSLFQFIHELNRNTLFCGSSRLDQGPCWNAKLMSRDPIELRDALSQIRERYYRAVGLPIVDLRK